MAALNGAHSVSYGAGLSSSGPFNLSLNGTDSRGWGGTWRCEMRRIEGTDNERPDSFHLTWLNTKNLSAELYCVRLHSIYAGGKITDWRFPISRVLESTDGSVDFRGLIPSRLWSSKATPPTSVTFYIRDRNVEVPKLSSLFNPADTLDSYSRNNVAFVFPSSSKILWANSEDLIKASEYFALMLGSSGFSETEETLEAPTMEEQLLEGVKGKVQGVAGAEKGADEKGKDLVKAGAGMQGAVPGSSESTAATSEGTEHVTEDSDNEDDQSASPFRRSPSRIHRIIVHDVFYKTYRAALYWIATGEVSFSHLSSLYPSGRPPATASNASSSAPSIPTASPKSLYRLSHFLSLPALSALAFSSLESQLCANNCLIELLSDLSADFEEVKEACMASVLKHWPAVVENGEIEELGRRVVEGELEGRKARIAWELMARLKPA